MKVKGLRWIILSLIMLVSIINYLDRGTLNYMWVANTKSEYPADRVLFDAAAGSCTLTAEDGTQITVPADRVTAGDDGTYVYTAVGGIAAELGILDPSMSEADFNARSKQMLANITIFFMIAYGLSQLFSGKLYDRIGTRRGFAFSALLWGAADALTALASGIKSLTCFRFLLGLGEAGPWPGTTKSNAEWFPSKERAMAQGLFNASTSVGLDPRTDRHLVPLPGLRLEGHLRHRRHAGRHLDHSVALDQQEGAQGPPLDYGQGA